MSTPEEKIPTENTTPSEMTRTTVFISTELYNQLKPHRSCIGVNQVCETAIANALHVYLNYQEALEKFLDEQPDHEIAGAVKALLQESSSSNGK